MLNATTQNLVLTIRKPMTYIRGYFCHEKPFNEIYQPCVETCRTAHLLDNIGKNTCNRWRISAKTLWISNRKNLSVSSKIACGFPIM